MIGITEAEIRAMRTEAKTSYPEECCGALLGAVCPETGRQVIRAVPIYNAREDERQRRYLIGPGDVETLEDAATRGGLDVLGFYHSHPDHPAVPSVFDRDHAWPWYTYVIVPVSHGIAGAPRAWQLSGDRADFDEIELIHKEAI